MTIKRVTIYIVLIFVYAFGLEKSGRLDKYNTGVYQGRRFIACALRSANVMYEYNAPTKKADSTYKYLHKKIEEAFYSELYVTIVYNNDSSRIIEDVKVTPLKLKKWKSNDKKYIKNWKKPTSKETAYNVGDSVIYGGRYVSLIDSNTWSPDEAPNYWRNTLGENVASRIWGTPTGAHNSFHKGQFILYKGGKYESVIDGNIWSPDEYRRGWKYIHRGPAELIDSSKLVDHSMPEPQTRTTAPTYSQPSGAHDAYKRGDVVSLNGTTYRSIIDANVWSPEVAQSYWEVLSSDTRSTVREWKKPTGVHDCYHKGYKMLFNGKTYESLMNSNVWSPEELPSSWNVVE